MIKLFFWLFLFFQIFQEAFAKNLFKFYNTMAIGINTSRTNFDIKGNKLMNGNKIDNFVAKSKKTHTSLVLSMDKNFLYNDYYYSFGSEHEVNFANQNKICIKFIDSSNAIRIIKIDFHRKHSHALFFKAGKKISKKVIVYGIFKTKINFVDMQLTDNTHVNGVFISKKNLDGMKTFYYINNGLGLGFSYNLKKNWLISADYLYNFGNNIRILNENDQITTTFLSANNNRSIDLKIKSSHTLGVKLHYVF